MSDEAGNVPYLICELANSHAGDVLKIHTLINEFAALDYPKKGIKFQIFHPEGISLVDFPWHSVYQELFFEKSVWNSLIEKASKFGDVWIDVFDYYSIDVIKENINKIHGIKLQASVLENEEIISKLQKLNLAKKYIIINISGFDLDKIGGFYDIFVKLSKKLIFQIGFQSYPTIVEDTGLQKIAVLQAAIPHVDISMADHAEGGTDFAQLVPIYAAILGCSYIEKHFCIDRTAAKYDGYSALQPEELAQMCLRLLDAMRSKNGFFISPSERAYLESTVQIPVAKKSLPSGLLLDQNHFIYRRTGQSGITWPRITELQRQGQRLAVPVAKNRTISEGQFRRAKVGVIVACRLKSTRLPRKAILPIAGVASVERCLEQCLAIRGSEMVVLASSDLHEDAELMNYLCDDQARFWAGDPEDVISRYLGACDKYDLDVIIRVTADCPLISHEIAEYLLQQHLDAQADYTSAADCAVGTSCEIIETSALRLVIELLGSAKHSEYMTWYFRNNPDFFKLNIVDLPPSMVRDYRLTLDHSEDLEVFESIYKALGSDQRALALEDVFSFLDSHPEVVKVNKHIELKYRNDEKLISLLNRETRILARNDSDENTQSPSERE